ncbi:MAG: hypothetical protein ACRD96_25425, partial [Bryobacteraceae bacterium]
ERLLVILPQGAEATTCHRVRWLDCACDVYSLGDDDLLVKVDPRDSGNLATRLDPVRQVPAEALAWVERIAALPGVERIDLPGGSVSLRVLGLEFARTAGGELLFGMGRRAAAREHHAREIEQLAREIAAMRQPGRPLAHVRPEAWLESRVRARLTALDASLVPAPVYGEVPACAGLVRGVIDLVAVDRTGRLAVLELKAAEDLHLPLQALDYWMRVVWHQERGEFAALGYFPGVALRKDAPRLLLVAPALDYHPTTETLLQFFSPAVEVERIGLNSNWRDEARVMFRARGAQRPGAVE